MGPVPPAAADGAAAAPQGQAAGGDNAQAIAIATAVAAALAANRPQPRRKLPRQLEWPELSRYQMYLGAQGGEQDFVTWWVGIRHQAQEEAEWRRPCACVRVCVCVCVPQWARTAVSRHTDMLAAIRLATTMQGVCASERTRLL